MIRRGSKPFPGCQALEDFTLGAGGLSGRATYKGARVHVKIPDDYKCPIGKAAASAGARIAEFEAYTANWNRRIEALGRCRVRDYLIPTTELILFDSSPRVRQAALISPFIEGLEKSTDLADRLNFSEKLQFTVTAFLQLRALHEDARLVHSDIKPPNALVHRASGTTQARFLDFDASFFIEEVPSPEEYVGDPYYFAPEVVAYLCGGKPHIGPKVDIFSLGIILAELFAGERMPGLDRASKIKYPADAMTASSLDPLAWLKRRGVEEELAKLLTKMLHPDPLQRPSSTEANDAMCGRYGLVGSGGAKAPPISSETAAFTPMKSDSRTASSETPSFAPMKGASGTTSSETPSFAPMKGTSGTTSSETPSFAPMKGASRTTSSETLSFAPMKGVSGTASSETAAFAPMKGIGSSEKPITEPVFAPMKGLKR